MRRAHILSFATVSVLLGAVAVACSSEEPRIVEKVEASIGPAGGSLSLTKSGARLDVPAGALPSAVTMGAAQLGGSAVAQLPSGVAAASPPISLTPAGQTLATPGTLSLPVAGGAAGGNLAVYRLDSETATTWQQVEGSTVEGQANIPVYQLGVYMVGSAGGGTIADASAGELDTGSCGADGLPEICNRMDDDCDGNIDEYSVDPSELCQGLANVATAFCEGRCFISQCLPGWTNADGDSTNGCEMMVMP